MLCIMLSPAPRFLPNAERGVYDMTKRVNNITKMSRKDIEVAIALLVTERARSGSLSFREAMRLERLQKALHSKLVGPITAHFVSGGSPSLGRKK